MKSNSWMVEQAKAQKNNAVYWYACYGQKASKELYTYKKKQYPKQYPPNNAYSEESYTCQYGKRAMDCSGLIKYCLWTTSINGEPKYDANQDLSANGFINSGCTQTGSIDTIPEIPGLIVWKEGHLGLYIGNGKVIESRGHSYGVVETNLKERGWLKWGKCKWVDYGATPSYTAEMAMAEIKLIVDKYYGNR